MIRLLGATKGLRLALSCVVVGGAAALSGCGTEGEGTIKIEGDKSKVIEPDFGDGKSAPAAEKPGRGAPAVKSIKDRPTSG
jgi:hypothetical protein